MTTMRKSAPHLQMISASNVAELSPLCTLRSQQASAIHDIKFSPDGERLATLNANGLVEIWDVMAFHHLFQVDTEAMFEHGHGLTFNVDGSRLLVTGSADKLARQYGADGSSIVFVVSCGVISAEYIEGENTIIYTPDGSSYVFGGPDGAIIYSDIHTGRMAQPAGVRGLAVQTLLFSPDGKMLVSTHPDNTMRVWDATTLKGMIALSGHHTTVRAIAFSPDSRMLASASAEKAIRLWDIQNGKVQTIFKGDLETVLGLAFNADGSLLASGGYDKQVTVWDVRDTSPIHLLSGEQGRIGAVAFNPSGTALAVAGADGTVQLWGVHALDQLEG